MSKEEMMTVDWALCAKHYLDAVPERKLGQMKESIETIVWDAEDQFLATGGAPAQPVLTYEEVCNVLALQEKVDLLTAENIALKTDNKNLIEMNFNLEKQLQAKSEDLEDALEACESWEERCDSLEGDKQDLYDTIHNIRELLG